MVTLADVQDRLEQLDTQIIALLHERVRICRETGRSLDGDQESELLSLWLEEAADRGIDEWKMERIAKLVLGMGRVVEE